MKITKKMFNFPPHISTTWDQIKSIYMKDGSLVISLINGEPVKIPNLPPETVETIFNAYATFLEQEPEAPKSASNQKVNSPFSQILLNSDPNLDLPFRFGLNTLDGMGAALQHNPAQMNAPDLPKAILQKIATIGKIITPEDMQTLPKPEPHCNCMHCQIIRAITQTPQTKEPVEEEVTEEDLNFRQWDISQSGDKLFTVINRLDAKEKYSVYLGHPIGCTCGKSGCEHIIAVLKS